MGNSRVRSKGGSLDHGYLKGKSDDKIKEGNDLIDGLGKKFLDDKEKLEAAIEKVQDSKISDDDKKAMIAELNLAIEAIKDQYDSDVTKVEERLKLEQLGLLESMQEAADEFEQQAEDLRSVKLEASATDASAAADEATAQKEIFEKTKAEYTEKLNLLIEQAAIQRRSIQSKKLSRGR